MAKYTHANLVYTYHSDKARVTPVYFTLLSHLLTVALCIQSYTQIHKSDAVEISKPLLNRSTHNGECLLIFPP